MAEEDLPDLREEEVMGLEPMGGRPQPILEEESENIGGVGPGDPGGPKPLSLTDQREGGGQDASIIPFLASDQRGVSPELRKARAYDKLGYLKGLSPDKVKLVPDKDIWNADYDPNTDTITIEGKFHHKREADKIDASCMRRIADR